MDMIKHFMFVLRRSFRRFVFFKRNYLYSIFFLFNDKRELHCTGTASGTAIISSIKGPIHNLLSTLSQMTIDLNLNQFSPAKPI